MVPNHPYFGSTPSTKKTKMVTLCTPNPWWKRSVYKKVMWNTTFHSSVWSCSAFLTVLWLLTISQLDWSEAWIQLLANIKDLKQTLQQTHFMVVMPIGKWEQHIKRSTITQTSEVCLVLFARSASRLPAEPTCQSVQFLKRCGTNQKKKILNTPLVARPLMVWNSVQSQETDHTVMWDIQTTTRLSHLRWNPPAQKTLRSP